MSLYNRLNKEYLVKFQLIYDVTDIEICTIIQDLKCVSLLELD